jgi:uncharacterized protein with HEPN domain
MSERNISAILQDILINIEAVLSFTQDLDKADFFSDLKTQYAADRCFEIIGEATRKLPDEFFAAHSEVEWHKMIAFRNILIHEYFRVEREIQWNIIQNVLPSLKIKIEEIILTLDQ